MLNTVVKSRQIYAYASVKDKDLKICFSLYFLLKVGTIAC
jgi:hypothetical protein